MMNKFTQFINKINEWRDKVMTEERKRDLQSVLQAGKKVVAKLKKYHDDKIISYDGADAFYSDAADYADNIDDAVERAFAGEEVFVEETDVEAGLSEKAFGYYEKIMNKLDSVKESIKGNESVAELLKKADGVFKNSSSLTKEELQAELDELMVELEDKLSVIADKTTAAATAIEGLNEQSKENYSNITTSITDVSDKADDMITTLSEVSAVLKSSAPKLEEIREASIGIDKLTDSVFELKNTNIKVKNEIEAINAKIRFLKIWGISACAVIALMAAAMIVLQIVF